MALLGVPLVPLYKAPRWLLISLCVLLLLEPPFLWQLASAIRNPDFVPAMSRLSRESSILHQTLHFAIAERIPGR